jgi:membrane-associated phospholipid phosphatase
MLSMIATLVISLAVTFGARWKISIHSAVAAGAVVTLAVVYGPWLWLLGLLVVLVCWSRVELRDHTTGQVIGGSFLGVLIGGFYFALLAIG